MAVELQMPKLGATMEKGTIIEWLKEEGDQVTVGEPILEIMTDKINIEVEAPIQGVLLKKLYEIDSEVPVLETIAYIGETGEEIVETTSNRDVQAGIVKKDNNTQVQQSLNTTVATKTLTRKIRRTPAALKLAKANGIDLQLVHGSGPNNRIQVRDVELFLDGQKLKISPLAKKIASVQQIDINTLQPSSTKIVKEDVTKKLRRNKSNSVSYKGIRKVVGERMAQSSATVPHVTLHTTIDMTKAIELRKMLLEKIQSRTGFRLSYTEILIKSVAHALKSHPMVNASLNGQQIDLHSDINIGLAVAIPNGLVVPVIRNADQKGLLELTVESKKLAKNAKENRLTTDDFSGGTFTISNLGMYAVDSFTPIINQPESAILGVGRIQEQVVSVNRAIVSRPQMALSLSFDHRVFDGAPAALFLTDLKEILENPYELMV
jgi:pyruvate dehydrogenase E2 component (dihydrolipoamide acetyltransferase)